MREIEVIIIKKSTVSKRREYLLQQLLLKITYKEMYFEDLRCKLDARCLIASTLSLPAQSPLARPHDQDIAFTFIEFHSVSGVESGEAWIGAWVSPPAKCCTNFSRLKPISTKYYQFIPLAGLF